MTKVMEDAIREHGTAVQPLYDSKAAKIMPQLTYSRFLQYLADLYKLDPIETALLGWAIKK